MPTWRASTIALLTVLALAPGRAEAEDRRLFLRFDGSQKSVEALAESEHIFTSRVLKESGYAFAGTTEMEGVFAECREAVGVSAAEERKCRLQAARRLFVHEVIEISLKRLRRGKYELTMAVWDPDANTQILADFVDVKAKRANEAAREGLDVLARRYLCEKGHSGHCEGSNDEVIAYAIGTVGTAELDSVGVGEIGSGGSSSLGSGSGGSGESAASCPEGQYPTGESGACCWRGQAHNGERCVGRPTSCPSGYSVKDEACALLECAAGMQRIDGVHCCWPEQAWLTRKGRCVGRPECPSGFVPVGETACMRDPMLSDSAEALRSMGLSDDDLRSLGAEGLDIASSAVVDTVGRLQSRGFDVQEVLAFALYADILSYESERAEHKAIAHVAGLSAHGRGSLTEQYNEAHESVGLEVAEWVAMGVGGNGLVWGYTAAGGYDTTAGAVITTAGWAALGTAIVLLVIDAGDIGALPPGFLEHEPIDVIRARLGDEAQDAPSAPTRIYD